MNTLTWKNQWWTQNRYVHQPRWRRENRTSLSHRTPKRVEAPSGTGGLKANLSQRIQALSLVNLELCSTTRSVRLSFNVRMNEWMIEWMVRHIFECFRLNIFSFICGFREDEHKRNRVANTAACGEDRNWNVSCGFNNISKRILVMHCQTLPYSFSPLVDSHPCFLGLFT